MIGSRLFDRYLLLRPRTRMLIEWPLLIATGLIGTIFSHQRIPFFPISNIIGVVLLVAAFAIHQAMHKVHVQAHEQAEEISKLVTNGVYTKMRHPGYSSLIFMYIGFALAWGILLIFVPVFVFAVLTVLTAMREEIVLRKKFDKEYKEYMKRVPWRFIPFVF